MSESVTKMLLTILTIGVIGGLGLGFCALMYHNGVDPLKDGALVALVGGLAGAAGRLSSGSKP